MPDPSLAPIRTICGWCERYGRTPVVLVDVPLDARGLSHGICPTCATRWLAEGEARSAARAAAVDNRTAAI